MFFSSTTIASTPSLIFDAKSIIIFIHFEVIELAHHVFFILLLIYDGTSPFPEYCGKCPATTYLLECYAFIKF